MADRFRPLTVVLQIKGASDDGERLHPVDLQAVEVPFDEFLAWAPEGLAELVARASEELAAKAGETTNGNGNRAARRAAAKKG